MLYFYYGSDQKLEGFSLNGTNYLYLRDAIGTINGILDADGTLVAQYLYDAWGNILSVLDGAGVDVSANASHIANVNPFRYRGYFYDADTGFYYLQSRYYDPVVGRFLNADDAGILGLVSAMGQAQDTLLGGNLYAYCANNPVMNVDPTGYWLARLICGVAGAAIFGTIANVFCRLLDVDSTTRRWITIGFAALGGVLGAVFGPTLLAKIAPKALNWINSVEKAMKSRFHVFTSDRRCIIGVEINSCFKLMLHWPHEGKGIHIAVEHKTVFGRWRKTIEDIEIKKIGSRFLKWIRK